MVVVLPYGVLKDSGSFQLWVLLSPEGAPAFLFQGWNSGCCIHAPTTERWARENGAAHLQRRFRICHTTHLITSLWPELAHMATRKWNRSSSSVKGMIPRRQHGVTVTGSVSWEILDLLSPTEWLSVKFHSGTQNLLHVYLEEGTSWRELAAQVWKWDNTEISNRRKLLPSLGLEGQRRRQSLQVSVAWQHLEPQWPILVGAGNRRWLWWELEPEGDAALPRCHRK